MLIAALAHAGRRRTRRLWQLAAVLWAVAVGTSRVYLGVHWPTDVLAGWLLALTLVLLAVGACSTTPNHQLGTPSPGAPGSRATADPERPGHRQRG